MKSLTRTLDLPFFFLFFVCSKLYFNIFKCNVPYWFFLKPFYNNFFVFFVVVCICFEKIWQRFAPDNNLNRNGLFWLERRRRRAAKQDGGLPSLLWKQQYDEPKKKIENRNENGQLCVCVYEIELSNGVDVVCAGRYCVHCTVRLYVGLGNIFFFLSFFYFSRFTNRSLAKRLSMPEKIHCGQMENGENCLIKILLISLRWEFVLNFRKYFFLDRNG